MSRLLERLLDALFAAVRAGLYALDLLGRFARLAPVRTSARVLALGSAHAILFLALVYLFLFRVTAGQIGVRQAQLGESGVEPRDFPPGLQRGLRWLNAWHVLDSRIHVAAFGLSGDAASQPALELRTKDGNLATVAAAVLYRIRPGEAWRLVADGLEASYPALAVAATASLLRSELAELSSDDFASTATRQARMAEALPRLNQRLGPLHLEAETIQLGDVSFWAEYQKALDEERFARESARLNAALARLERERGGDPSREEIDTPEEIDAEEKRLRAESERELEGLRSAALLEIARIRSAAESHALLRRSEADAAHERELAAGRLVLDRAETEREQGLATALQGEAGRIWQAREAAGKLKVRKAQLNASDPRLPPILDLDGITRLLLGALPPR